MLWTCVLLPSLALDVFARAAPDDTERPFVVASGGHYPRVVAANGCANAAGIRGDQLISAALAFAPDVVVRDRDGDAEAAALAEVATLLLAFTPQVSIVHSNAVVAEIAGSMRLFGGLTQLLALLGASVESRGYARRMAVAPTPTAALMLARAGHTQPVLRRSALPDVLSPLPLTLLDFEPTTLATLKAAGVTTFGAAHALPRAGLARRFGQHVVDRLDRALDRAPDPQRSYEPPPRFERKLVLPAPIDNVEALGFGVNRLIGDLAGWLLARGLGVVRMSLALIHERYVRDRGIPPSAAEFRLGAPARAPAHLHAVMRERLARVTLPASVEAIVLTSDETAPLAGRNFGLLPEDEVDAVVVPLVDRLRSRLGDDVVTVLATHPEHRPEYATSATTPETRSSQPRTHAHSTGPQKRNRKASPLEQPSAATDAPRPLWLLDEAKILSGALETAPWILRDGPERIESGWWDGHDLRRDYFVAETPQGGMVWIYRDHRYGTDDGEWFMHGVFA
ncbi:MAG TPA: DNA polymerase Y family protein [Casimicrobiaceae bacterium]|nr:DNA polymerase Y family protein [Casimicrobiaceae bacterium]